MIDYLAWLDTNTLSKDTETFCKQAADGDIDIYFRSGSVKRVSIAEAAELKEHLGMIIDLIERGPVEV